MPHVEVQDLLAAVRDKQEEFIRQHVIRELLQRSGAAVENFLRRFSVYRLPVEAHGAECIAPREEGLAHGAARDWRTLLNEGVRLSLVEHDHARNTYWLTPLLREELWNQLQVTTSNKQQATSNQIACHEAACAYYEKVCGERIDPILTEEWIYHALGCGREDVAADKGGDLIKFLRENLAYWEAKRIGEWILAKKQQPLVTGDDAKLLYEISTVFKDLGDIKKAMPFVEKELAICRTIYGENHTEVAARLNNLGFLWDTLGDHKKAIGYYEQALAIDRVVYGGNHPNVAIRLNNLGSAWNDLGEHQKAIDYCEQALAIDRAVYGDNHPSVARELNNLGAAWKALGEHQKAINYYEQALVIDRAVYGDNHPECGQRTE